MFAVGVVTLAAAPISAVGFLIFGAGAYALNVARQHDLLAEAKGKTLAQEGRKATTQEIQDHKQDKRRLLNPLARIR